MLPNKKFWNNKRVLITGHTGFKGGWLSTLLYYYGCKISGYALNPEGKIIFNSVKIKNLFVNDFKKILLI